MSGRGDGAVTDAVTTPALELHDAALRYGRHAVWSQLTLKVAPGEFLAVLGANGSGKTSLLRAVLGLQPLTGGSVLVGDRQAQRGSRQIGYVQQRHHLDAGTTLRARDVVRLGLDGHLWGFARPGHGGWRAVEAALRQVGASEYANVPFGLLSGGEQQKVRIAQGLVCDPGLLLCDEPLLSLDIASQRAVAGLVDRRCREHGTAVVFVTHEINPILPYADRILYLADGRFRVGTVDQVMNSRTLSDLFRSPIEVVRAAGRILVAGIPDTPPHATQPGAPGHSTDRQAGAS